MTRSIYLLLTALFLSTAAARAGELRISLSSDIPDGDFIVYKGDRFSVSFEASHDAYVTIVALDEKRNVRILFPNRWQPDNEVRRGQRVTVDGIHADFAGPVYLEAIAAASEAFYFRHGDDENPFWTERWGRFDPEDSFLGGRRGSFTISFDDAVSEPAMLDGRYDASLRDELADQVDADYDAFEPEVREMRDDVHEVMGGETWSSAYLDVYVASSRFDPDAYAGSDDDDAGSVAAQGEDAGDDAEGDVEDEGDLEVASDAFDYETAIGDYGTWIEIRGIRVWRPPVFSIAWRPFSHGYWIWSSFGWYWVGYEPFAWVTYHYGYWYCDAAYGWYWIPDYTSYRFVPANCHWYSTGNYIGWYPAPPPAAVSNRLNIRVPGGIDVTRAVLVDRRNFLKDDIHEVMEPPARVTALLRGGPARFARDGAPRKESLESSLGHKIEPTPVSTVRKPTRGKQEITLVRPMTTRTPPPAFRTLENGGRKKSAAAARSGSAKDEPASGSSKRRSAEAPRLPAAPANDERLLKPRPTRPPADTRRPPQAPGATPASTPRPPDDQGEAGRRGRSPAPRTAPAPKDVPSAKPPAPERTRPGSASTKSAPAPDGDDDDTSSGSSSSGAPESAAPAKSTPPTPKGTPPAKKKSSGR